MLGSIIDNFSQDVSKSLFRSPHFAHSPALLAMHCIVLANFKTCVTAVTRECLKAQPYAHAGESDAPQGVVNTSDGRVVRAFHRFTLVDQTGQGRDLTKGRRRDQVNEQVLPPPTFLAYLCLSACLRMLRIGVAIGTNCAVCNAFSSAPAVRDAGMGHCSITGLQS